MANDPHRRQRVPSLRYWAHLVAPGWNVIGGGEPALPGLSIGHNEHGAWGLTIFSIDQEDLMVYDTNPHNPNQYRYRDAWENMEIVKETIPVKNEKPVEVELKYTRHGPVISEDTENRKAYALKAAWLEIGTAPYLASLRMDQAKSWQEFREACSYSGTPSENMVWADKNGNIGWQAVGMAPLRNGWDGILPVPGDGRFEWNGYLPIKSLPHVYNPPEGHFATANQNNVPKDYPYFMGLRWADPFRFNRIEEVLNSGRKFTITDNMLLQNDELSIPARSLVPLLRHLPSNDEKTEEAIALLLDWDCVLDMHSAAAAIYIIWKRRLFERMRVYFVPEYGRKFIASLPLEKAIGWLTAPDGRFGSHPTRARDKLMLNSLKTAVNDLTEIFGADMRKWRYGDEKFHHIKYEHVLSEAVNAEVRKKLDVGPLPRGGNGYTVNNTSNGNIQTSGASFRIIADTGDWDRSAGTNTPGQSGAPDNPHYSNLFEMWATGKYFPIFFSRKKVASVAESTTILKPQ
jgi:penicillin amidase